MSSGVSGLVDFLACTVRGCYEPLTRQARSWRCRSGHSFDIAKRGYVNLLQPQDRRSPAAGDSAAALAARTRLLEAGVGRDILEAFVERASRLDLSQGRMVELGCGGGDLLSALAARRSIAGAGLDLSVVAIEQAARRSPSVTWVVANADRRLPVQDQSIDLVLSFNGRRNPRDAARVLTTAGCVLVAIPSDDDLIELRASVQGEAVARDRVDALVAEYAHDFELAERSSVRERHTLNPETLNDLLTATYRGARTSAADRREALKPMTVTLGTEVMLFRRRRGAGERGSQGRLATDSSH